MKSYLLWQNRGDKLFGSPFHLSIALFILQHSICLCESCLIICIYLSSVIVFFNKSFYGRRICSKSAQHLCERFDDQDNVHVYIIGVYTLYKRKFCFQVVLMHMYLPYFYPNAFFGLTERRTLAKIGLQNFKNKKGLVIHQAFLYL
jgi:hypothetical protein